MSEHETLTAATSAAIAAKIGIFTQIRIGIPWSFDATERGAHLDRSVTAAQRTTRRCNEKPHTTELHPRKERELPHHKSVSRAPWKPQRGKAGRVSVRLRYLRKFSLREQPAAAATEWRA